MTTGAIEKGDLAEMPDGSLAEVLSIVWPKAWVRSNGRLMLVPLGELAKLAVSAEIDRPVTIEFDVERHEWVAYAGSLGDLFGVWSLRRNVYTEFGEHGVGPTPNRAAADLLYKLEAAKRAREEEDPDGEPEGQNEDAG